MTTDPEPLRELEDADPFAPHDLGCRCYPHVSQRAAIEASVQAATAEYRAARAAAPSDGLREAAAAMLEPIDHRGEHEHSSWPSSECDECLAVRKGRADRLRAALTTTVRYTIRGQEGAK